MNTTSTHNQSTTPSIMDSLTARRRIMELRFQVAGKKRDIAKTTNPRLIIAMQKDVIYWEAEIARLVKLCPKALGFRDVVDHHMSKGN
jgi:hypothetical protein